MFLLEHLVRIGIYVSDEPAALMARRRDDGAPTPEKGRAPVGERPVAGGLHPDADPQQGATAC